MPRHVFLSGIALYLLTLAFLLTEHLTFTPGVTERNCRRIRPGMSLEEVERILGRSASWELAIDPLQIQGIWVNQPQTGSFVGCTVYFNSCDVVEFARWGAVSLPGYTVLPRRIARGYHN
jgi:hypothetical protein